jgi:SSS family solute:Na+ symporter
MQLIAIDWVILGVYFVFVLGIGYTLRRYMRTSTDYFLSGRSIPAWVAGLAFLSANLGAQEVIGMAASGAKYGMATSHFYWIGAIPAMVFLGVFMMPFYYGSRARSVPEYLKLRFDEKTRGLNAISFAAMTIFSSGISMYAMALLTNLLLGWSFGFSIWVCAGVVLLYILFGGLTSAIYNEVLQFFLIVFGFAPLVFVGLQRVGGWHGLQTALQEVATSRGFADGAWTHTWSITGDAAANPMGLEWVRHCDGARLRAVVRLLVHGFPGRAARDGGELDVRRPPHAADRSSAEDVVSFSRDRAGHDRNRADSARGHERLRPCR